jgi:hypothetical protein
MWRYWAAGLTARPKAVLYGGHRAAPVLVAGQALPRVCPVVQGKDFVDIVAHTLSVTFGAGRNRLGGAGLDHSFVRKVCRIERRLCI